MPRDRSEEDNIRRRILIIRGTPTKEDSGSSAVSFTANVITKDHPHPETFLVHPDFVASLAPLRKTSADVDLIPRDSPEQKAELAKVFASLNSGQSLDILGVHLNVSALDRVLLGQGNLGRFRVDRLDRNTGLEVVDYFLPCIDDKTGRIALIRLDLETKGQLQDAALKRSGEKLIQTESRLDLPSNIRVGEETKTIVGIDHPVKVESAVGTLTIAGRVVTVESASTVGGREGVDEDYSLLRQYNIPEIGEFTVASIKDGMGGAAAGEVASQIAANAETNLLIELSANRNSTYHAEIKRLANSKHSGDKRAALIDLLVSTQNKAVYDEKQKNNTDMGTTTTEYFIFDDAIYQANVGDSRGYFDSGGGSYRVSNDHSLVESLVSIGQITPVEALNHPQRNGIYRSLGGAPTVTVDIKKIGIPKGEFSLLVCCDGFSGSLKDPSGGKYDNGRRSDPAQWFSPQIDAAIKAHPGSPAETISSTVATGITTGTVDNTTYMALKFSAPQL